MSKVVPKSNCWVLSWASHNERSLDSDIYTVYCSWMEATAYQVKFNVSRNILVQTYCFNMNQPNIIILALYSEILFAGTHRETQNFYTFCIGWLPFSNKVIGLLARCRIVLIWSNPHSHVARVWGDEETFWEFFNWCYISYLIFFFTLAVKSILNVLLSLWWLNKDLSFRGCRSHLVII